MSTDGKWVTIGAETTEGGHLIKSKKRIRQRSRNLRITTRISLATIFGIVIPVVLVAVFSSVFLTSMTKYFNFSAVTTNSYSMLNQIQWSQTVSSLSDELISSRPDEEKYEKIDRFVTPVENIGARILIEKDGQPFYATGNRDDVLREAQEIAPGGTDRNLNYFGDNGMVIITHAEGSGSRYLVVIESKNYTVQDISEQHATQTFSQLVFGKTGVVLLIIVMIFIVSILALSFITSHAINKPIKELADGANEIANGNLDYTIDYNSTNEIGQTVKAFNAMTRRLKQSIENQNRLEQSRKEMIAGVAHDLRTPLTSVKGYVEGLIDGIANTPEKQERYLKTIYASTLSMENMLDDLLSVSRLELGDTTLHTSTVELGEVLDDCAEEISLQLEKNDFDFVYENHCPKPTYLELDVDGFKRVVQNIISNSLKYARKDVKGRITLEAQAYQKSVIISLSDNGIGVEAENLPRIFETFYRADKARTRVSDGSGIGLSVCRKIIELHGGHIWATGTEGEGLTVLISLEKKNTEQTEGQNG